MAGYEASTKGIEMSDHVSDMDDQMRKDLGLGVQPAPIHNDLPSAHDLVIEDIHSADTCLMSAEEMYTMTLEMFEELAFALGKDPALMMAARKEFGLQKYGTTLQPNNGRNHLEDALDEMADTWVYLRCDMYEQEGE